MKETGILFKPVLVKATLDGRKTETRRTRGLDEINKNPGACNYQGSQIIDGVLLDCFSHENGKVIQVKCPYGIPGDRLWVKETWAEILNEGDPRYQGKSHFEYKIDTGSKYPGEWPDDKGDDPQCPRWKSPMFMPRRAARLVLPIKNISIERLHDITEESAKREGVPISTGFEKRSYRRKGYTLTAGYMFGEFRDAFHYFWDYINGPGAWEKNPWVRVIKFKKEV